MCRRFFVRRGHAAVAIRGGILGVSMTMRQARESALPPSQGRPSSPSLRRLPDQNWKVARDRPHAEANSRTLAHPMSEAEVDARREQVQVPDAGEFDGGEIPAPPTGWPGWPEWTAEQWPPLPRLLGWLACGDHASATRDPVRLLGRTSGLRQVQSDNPPRPRLNSGVVAHQSHRRRPVQ